MTQELLEQVFDPAVEKTQQVADLNQHHDPEDLSHYVKVSQMDEKIMGADIEVRALCGFTWARRQKADVGVFARGHSLELEVCPQCHVLYSMLTGPGGRDD